MKTEVQIKPTVGELARTAILSDETRGYLIVCGKLADIENEFYDLISRDFGDEQVESIVDPFVTTMCEARTKVEQYLLWSITERLYNLGGTNV